MKIVIDIPEDMYKDADILIVKDLPELKKIIANGIPYEENPQGKWEHDKLFGDCAYVCSFCHTIWMSSEIQNMHYCPTCGASMQKGGSNR